MGYREPHIWTDVLQGAAEMLEEGGILFMYDTEAWPHMIFQQHSTADVVSDCGNSCCWRKEDVTDQVHRCVQSLAMALASQHETRCAASQTTEEKWGDFANVEKMKDHITKADLDLELIEKDEPVDWSDDVDGRMFTLVFKKVKAPKRKSLEWLIQKADDFKQAGNSGSFGELWPVEGWE